MRTLCLLLLAVLPCGDAASIAGPVVVTGATGRTGALVYNLLKEKGVSVRAFVRNATKARELLGCAKCDESEGIFVGDVSDPASLVPPMQGAGALVVATSSVPICDPFPKCHFPEGGHPVDVDWKGEKVQLETFASATKGQGPVVLISTMGTTSPEPDGDPFEFIGFYKLNFEAMLATSGLPYVIIKPCGLINDEPKQRELIVGHEDEVNPTPPLVTRGDVARVVVAALDQPMGLRFDLCSRVGTPTTDADLPKLLHSARYPWARSGDETLFL